MSTLAPIEPTADELALMRELANYWHARSREITGATGWRPVPAADAPNTWPELRAVPYPAMPIYSGHCDRTIYAPVCKPHDIGTVRDGNISFRFAHDCEHRALGADFTYEGERLTIGAQLTRAHQHISAAAYSLARCDLMGQLWLGRDIGGFADDQAAFTLTMYRSGYWAALAREIAYREGAK